VTGAVILRRVRRLGLVVGLVFAALPVGVALAVPPTDNDLALTGVPANITTSATGPGGAVVTYTPPTATDEGESVPVVCVPPSGSSFPIGLTTVTCTATDADDSNSPVQAQFTVTVTTPLQNVFIDVGALPPSTIRTILTVQVGDAISAFANGNTARVCLDLNGIIRTAGQGQTYGQLTNKQATLIIFATDTVGSLLGCAGFAPPCPPSPPRSRVAAGIWSGVPRPGGTRLAC
jgi:HYR domain